jgi:hypothetical protein
MEPAGLLAIIFWVFIFFAIKIGCIGMALLIYHSKSDFIERANEQYQKNPNVLMTLVGLANGFIIPFIAVIFLNVPWLALVGLGLLLFYLWLVLLSYTLIYRDVGTKLFSNADENTKITLYGGMVAEAAFFAPVLGQLFSLYLFIRSLGAVTMAFMTRNRSSIVPD